MAATTGQRIEAVLNNFAEIMSGLMIDRHHQHVAELDLTLPQAQVLRILRRGSLPAGQLATELRISAPATTQLTDRLIRKQLIERESKDGDRRTVLVKLSVKGKRLVDQFRKRRSDIFSNALARLDDDEQAVVIEAFEKVIKCLESYEAQTNCDERDSSSNKRNK
jgi:DNA-binding MarR family transcriptional regulator